MGILQIDENILVWLNKTLLGHSHILDLLVKLAGVYLIYALPVILIVLWFVFPKKQVTLLLCMLAVIFSWFVLTKSVGSYLWHRPRPEMAVIGLKEVFFHRPDYSFPSDHATALFAIAFGLYIFNWKKAGSWFLLYSLIIVICRVAIGVHYPLDIIGGVASALIGVSIIYLVREPITKYVFEPTIGLLRKVKLS
jgi:undecaprenyl-diphosphatase